MYIVKTSVYCKTTSFLQKDVTELQGEWIGLIGNGWKYVFCKGSYHYIIKIYVYVMSIFVCLLFIKGNKIYFLAYSAMGSYIYTSS